MVALEEAIITTLVGAGRTLTTDELAAAVAHPAAELRPILLDMARRGLVQHREVSSPH
jgi:hypothetical protein